MADTGRKRYLGDGVYADFDGFAIVLTTENGISVQHRIELEPEVCAALLTYISTAFQRKRDDLETLAARNLARANEPEPPHDSARSCGCDPGAHWICEQHRTETP